MAARRFALLAWLAIALMITGCASPHYLQPAPKRTASVPLAGQGQTVIVTAVDERQGEVIGTRSGSAMSTSTIIVDPKQLSAALQAEAERAVRDMGFTPSASGPADSPRLTLTLAQLGYKRGDSQALVDEAKLQAVVVAEAVNAGTTYTGTYTATRSQQYAIGIRPSKKSNLAMIETLLADALNRAFSDPELAQLLAR